MTAARTERDAADRSAGSRRPKSLIVRIDGARQRVSARSIPRRAALAAALLLAVGCGDDEHPPAPAGTHGGAAGQGTSGNGGTSVAGAAGGAPGAGGFAGTSGAAGASAEQSCSASQSCQRLCSAVGADPSRCGLGNAAQCRCICEERFAEPCPDELDALGACIGAAPSIDCSVRGRIFPGCEEQSFALELCDFGARDQLCAADFPECAAYCRGAALAFCPLGPETLSSCLCGCEASLVTTCSGPFESFMACSAGAPAFSCDAGGRVVAASCPSEWQALAACMDTLADPGPPDAG